MPRGCWPNPKQQYCILKWTFVLEMADVPEVVPGDATVVTA